MNTITCLRSTTNAAAFGMLALLCTEVCNAAMTYITYAPIKGSEMPFFVGDNQKAADRVNKVLYQGLPPTKQKVLEKNEPVPDGEPGESYSFDVIRNDDKILTVSMYSEGCGASCSSSTDRYNFDARTGLYIHVTTLFTEKGLKAVSEKLVEQWSASIKQDPDDSIDVDGCIESMKSNYGKGTPYLGWDFTFDSKGISFDRPSCWKYDGPYTVHLDTDEMLAFLSPYGQYILSRGPVTAPPVSIYGQTYRGSINDKYKITMFLIEPYPSAGYLDGYYYYDKYKTPIRLTAQFDGHTLEAIEYNGFNQTDKKIVAQFTTNTLQGTWTDGKKTLPFAVTAEEP